MRHNPVDSLASEPNGGAPGNQRRASLQGLALAAALALVPALALAQTGDWPTKPVRMIVNFAPGSSPDIIGRAIASVLSPRLGQPVVIENRTGAGGTVGVEAAAKSPPDGYTILMTAGSTMSIGPLLNTSLPYNQAKDLAPVAATARIENFLVIRSELPVKTYAEFVTYAKRNPGKLSYGSAGNGTSPHIAAEMWKAAAGVFAVHIPYRGTAPAIQDMLAGQIDFMFDSGSSLPHVRSGRFLILGVASPKRLPALPDLPTFEELGLKGLETGTTHSIYAPAAVPVAILDRLNREINAALNTPSVAQQIRGLAAEPTPMSRDALAALMAADMKRYEVIVRKQNIKAD